MNYVQRIATFAAENPAVMTLIVWPLITALFNFIFRPRTEEERAKLRQEHPVWAEVVRLIGGLGLDPVKSVEALKGLLDKNNSSDKNNPPPAGGATPLLVVASLAVILPMSACTPQARALLVDALVRKIECGIAHQDLPDTELLAKCAVQPEDAKAVLDAVGKSRAVGADHAYAAASIAKKDAADKCEAAGAFKR